MQKLLLKPHLFHKTIKDLKVMTRRIGSLKAILNPDKWRMVCVSEIQKGWMGINNKKQLRTSTYAYFERTNKKTAKLHTKMIRARFNVGEVVALAEPVYTKTLLKKFQDITLVPYWYEYDLDETVRPEYKEKYHRVSSMFMRGFHYRHFIKITAIRCERLQDITERQVMDEGVDFSEGNGILTFSVLFDKINGVGSWRKNQFVWVYEYEYLKGYKRSDSVKS